jgi:hypothetical protein
MIYQVEDSFGTALGMGFASLDVALASARRTAKRRHCWVYVVAESADDTTLIPVGPTDSDPDDEPTTVRSRVATPHAVSP